MNTQSDTPNMSKGLKQDMYTLSKRQYTNRIYRLSEAESVDGFIYRFKVPTKFADPTMVKANLGAIAVGEIPCWVEEIDHPTIKANAVYLNVYIAYDSIEPRGVRIIGRIASRDAEL